MFLNWHPKSPRLMGEEICPRLPVGRGPARQGMGIFPRRPSQKWIKPASVPASLTIPWLTVLKGILARSWVPGKSGAVGMEC